MANDKGYDELLKMFEEDDKSEAASKSAQSNKSGTNSASAGVQKSDVNFKTPGAVVNKNSSKIVEDRASAEKKAVRTTAPKPTAKKPSAPPVKEQKTTVYKKIDSFDDVSSDSGRENNGIKSGVYFSNPPKDIENIAKKEQGVPINSETKRRVSKRSEALKQSAQVKKRKKSDKLKAAGIMLGIIAVVSAILCYYAIGCINDVLALHVDELSVEVRVEKGMTDDEVIDILHDNGLIKNKMFCKLFIKFFNTEGDYKSGFYTLSREWGVEKMLATMKTDFRSSETVSLTFPEGWTIKQIADKLEANGVCTASSFISTLQSVDFSSEYEFVKSIPDKNGRFRTLEGYIFPDTYEFYKGENASSVVRRFLNNFENKWNELYKEKADELGLSVDEVIIMASILQKEAASSEQMPTIAGILYNRLDRPSVFPLLQCDSTTDYLQKEIKPELTSSVEDTQKYIEYRDSYDTYSDACTGLPVGAICNPGSDAINAALNYEDTSYLYFRHDKNGGVYYANTLAEHEENGRKAANVE